MYLLMNGLVNVYIDEYNYEEKKTENTLVNSI